MKRQCEVAPVVACDEHHVFSIYKLNVYSLIINRTVLCQTLGMFGPNVEAETKLRGASCTIRGNGGLATTLVVLWVSLHYTVGIRAGKFITNLKNIKWQYGPLQYGSIFFLQRQKFYAQYANIQMLVFIIVYKNPPFCVFLCFS